MGDLILDHLPALIAMVLGYGLLVLEMYIPGFGAPGILGVVLAVTGLVFMQPTALQALIIVVIYVAILSVALVICLRTASKGRFANSRFVLKDSATSRHEESENELAYFIGKTGQAHTPLRPAGIADFDGVRLNVVSEGDFIDRDTPVRVICVEGKRIVVAPHKS